MIDLKKKNFILTGANGQLGRSTSDFLKQYGANVIGFDVLDFDLQNKDDVYSAYRSCFKEYGKIDGLINNAGTGCFEDPLDRIEENFDRTYSSNLKGSFNSIQSFVKCFDSLNAWAAAFPALPRTQSSAVIVNIASIYGFISPNFSIYPKGGGKSAEIYGATKAGVIQFTKYFSVYLAGRKIRVNCISPGGLRNHQNPQPESFIKNYSEKCPMGRLGEYKEVVGGIGYLLSDLSSYVNGHNLIIDGGYSCW